MDKMGTRKYTPAIALAVAVFGITFGIGTLGAQYATVWRVLAAGALTGIVAWFYCRWLQCSNHRKRTNDRTGENHDRAITD